MSDVINKLNEVVKEVNVVYFPQARIAQLEQQNKEAVEFMREIEKELEGILEQGKIEMGALKLRAEAAEEKVKTLEGLVVDLVNQTKPAEHAYWATVKKLTHALGDRANKIPPFPLKPEPQ